MRLLVPIVRLRAVVGLGLAQLARSRARTILTVLAVALAVLSVTLLAGLGVGVVDQADQGLADADRDIWIAGDPVDDSTGGTENPIVGAHEVTSTAADHEGVETAAPMALHEVYLGTEGTGLERRPAVGVYATHDGYEFEAGGGFAVNASAVDPHDGELASGEIVVDPRIADAHDLEVGDTVAVGTSRETAEETSFTVVGISTYHSQYLGTPAVTVPLIDLQTVAGTTGTDRATFVTADVAEDADRDAVRDDLAAALPEYDVRTSDDQAEAVIRDRPVVLASGFTLSGLAVVTGIAMTINLFALVVSQQRAELAALRAIGLSRWTLAGTIGTQGFVIGLLGGLVGLTVTPLLASGLNRLAVATVGIDGLVQVPLEVYALGGAVALVVGTTVALVTGWRAGRYARIEHLED